MSGGAGAPRSSPGGADATGTSREGLILSGRLEESSFADLMKSLGRSGETALVTASREGVTKTVYVLDGRIIFARSTDPDERLGECMLRDGTITIEQYEESVRRIRPGKRQGTILVELGYITPNELVRGVKSQVEQVVMSLFRWRTGDYEIEISDLDTADIITLNISTENLIFNGIKRGAGWSQVLRGLGGSLETVLDRAPDADSRLYKLDFSDDEAHVYSLANGRLSVAQICAMSYLSNHDTCVVLWGLTCCGMLNPVSSKDAESLFRQQVAEFEIIEIRDRIEEFNGLLRDVRDRIVEEAGDTVARELLEKALAEVLDEHYDVFREVDATSGEVDPDLVVENVSAVDAGRRRRLVQEALEQLLVALLLGVRLGVSAELEETLARQVSERKTR